MTKKFEDSTLVIDLETTVRCPIGNNKGHPRWPANHIVMIGDSHLDQAKAGFTYATDSDGLKPASCTRSDIEKHRLLVGHNIGFDIQWLYRLTNEELYLGETNVWDTGIAAYILSGQEHRWPSLDELSEAEGLPKKDDKVKVMWDSGMDTTDIPSELLIPYCLQDVTNTKALFLKQIKQAHEAGCFKLIMVLNDALLAVTEMQWNGMKVDRKKLKKFRDEYENYVKDLSHHISTTAASRGMTDINIGSWQQLSVLLYGGEYKVETLEEIGEYKTGVRKGEKRYKKHITYKTIEPLYHTNLGSTDDEALNTILNDRTIPTECEHLVQDLVEYRKVSKQLSQYFNGTLDLLFPEDYIYHNINSTATVTGRYSSSNPNLQNVTSDDDSDIKKCYISRYEGGSLVEADFKQLEVVALAELSGDTQLIEDIKKGVDLHTTLFKQTFGRAPTSTERRDFKRAVFAMLYGAGVKKLSSLTGLPVSEMKRFMGSWATRYPMTRAYWNDLDSFLRTHRQPSDKVHELGFPLKKAKYQMPSGRILTFYEKLPPWVAPKLENAHRLDFSINEIKDYPMQSFATGDLVPLFLGKLWRALKRKQKNGELLSVRLVNTVHDSLLADMEKEDVQGYVMLLEEVRSRFPQYVKQEFGMDLKCPFNLSISAGPNWNELETL